MRSCVTISPNVGDTAITTGRPGRRRNRLARLQHGTAPEACRPSHTAMPTAHAVPLLCRAPSFSKSYTEPYLREDGEGPKVAPGVAPGRDSRLPGWGKGSVVAPARGAVGGNLGPRLGRLFQFLPGDPGVRQCCGDRAGSPYSAGNPRKHRDDPDWRVSVCQSHRRPISAIHHFLLLAELRGSRQRPGPGRLSLG